MSHLLIWTGFAAWFVCGLWVVVLAWQRGILWGLGCLLMPVVWFLYVGLHWRETRKPFLFMIVGVALVVLGDLMRQ